MEISTVSSFMYDRFKSNPLTNTISFMKQDEIDFNKGNIYPLVNIDMTQSEVLDTIHRVTFVINIYQQRDTKPLTNLNNKLLTTNMIDNLNESYFIGSKFINQIKSFNNTEEIELFNVTPITFQKNVGTQLLDGIMFTITLDVPDSTGC